MCLYYTYIMIICLVFLNRSAKMRYGATAQKKRPYCAGAIGRWRSRIDGKAGNRRSQRAYGAVRHSPTKSVAVLTAKPAIGVARGRMASVRHSPNIAIGIGKEKRRRVFESSRGAKACVRNSVVLGKSMKNANIVRKSGEW